MANAGATVTVEWGYETHSITLTPKNWARVKYAPPDEPFGSRVETLAVGCCVPLGTLENKPFSVAKIAAYMHIPRNTVTRRLERLIQHWGIIERRGRHYYLRPEVANRPRALASYREVRRAIQRAVAELSILDAAEN